VSPGELGHGRRRVALAERHAAGEAQLALGDHCFRPDRGLGLFEVGQQLYAALVDRLACFGQRQATRRPVEQPDLEVRLQLRDLAGDRGRRHLEALGGGGEGAELDDLGERVQ